MPWRDLTTNREQYQARLNIAAVRRKKTKSTDGAARAEAKLVWIMPSRDRGRRQSIFVQARAEH